MFGSRRGWGFGIAALLAVSGFGCAKPKSDLLFVYSGDVQGYLEPCG